MRIAEITHEPVDATRVRAPHRRDPADRARRGRTPLLRRRERECDPRPGAPRRHGIRRDPHESAQDVLDAARRQRAPERSRSRIRRCSSRRTVAACRRSGCARNRPISAAVYGRKLAGTCCRSKRNNIQFTSSARRASDNGDDAIPGMRPRYSRPPATRRYFATSPAIFGAVLAEPPPSTRWQP